MSCSTNRPVLYKHYVFVNVHKGTGFIVSYCFVIVSHYPWRGQTHSFMTVSTTYKSVMFCRRGHWDQCYKTDLLTLFTNVHNQLVFVCWQAFTATSDVCR
jgi:hypothetical protein